MNSEPLHYNDTDPFGRRDPVWVFDDLTVRPGCQERLLGLVNGTYLPLAKARDLELIDLWLLPPFERPEATADIVLLWKYPSLDDLWRVRGDEESDERLVQFWAEVDQLVVRRSRRLGRPPAMMKGLGPIAPLPGDMPVVSARRRLLFIGTGSDVAGEQRAAWLDAAAAQRQQCALRVSTAGFYEPYSFMPGQLIWEVAEERSLAGSTPTGTDESGAVRDELLATLPGRAVLEASVELSEPIGMGVREPALRGVKRTILFGTIEGLDANRQTELEQALLDVPRHIDAIRNWRLSRVTASSGAIAWTHCFEQEATDTAVFLGPYLNHPYHWAVVDRLFHPEAPERVADRFGQVIQAIDRSVIAQS